MCVLFCVVVILLVVVVVVFVGIWFWCYYMFLFWICDVWVWVDVVVVVLDVFGWVIDLEVKDNQVVKVGDVLMCIDQECYQVNLEQVCVVVEICYQ